MSGRRWLVAVATTGLLACGNDADGRTGGDMDNADPAEREASVGDGQVATSSGEGGVSSGDGGVSSGARADGSVGEGNSCATVSMGVGLEPVHLAFGFDVSGSMGEGDKAWHNKMLKWDPVVSATRSFFSSPNSAGLSASLTFFPGADAAKICDAGEYTKPNVAMTPLPSALFGDAITAVTPAAGTKWRSGTPTVAVMKGLQTAVGASRATKPGRYAIVMVTDGYPQSCSGQNEVRLVAAEAAKALTAKTPTYVIGVANPMVKDAPENVTGLHEIAKAGGTSSAFVIDTGDAAATATAFTNAIAKIRTAAVSCSVAIPTSSERAFDKSRVTVHYNGALGTTNLTYDPACKASHAWHYDNATDPKEIELCASTCDAVRADPTAQLEVGFACKAVIVF